MLLFHEVCHSSKIYLLIDGLKLENGILKEVGSNERIQIRPDILSGLTWAQNVCKGYQETTKVATSMKKVYKNLNKTLTVLVFLKQKNKICNRIFTNVIGCMGHVRFCNHRIDDQRRLR